MLLHLFIHVKISLVLRGVKKEEPCMHNALRLHVDAEQAQVKLHSAPPSEPFYQELLKQ